MTVPQTEQLAAGRELDALVAEKVFGAFGFENIDVVNGTPNELFAVLPGNRAVNRVPYFSTDIAAAWEVVAKMRERGLDVYLRFVSTWTAEFDSVSGDVNGFADADTAPLAICLAALKAVQS